MNRRDLIKIAAAAVATPSFGSETQSSTRGAKTIKIENDQFELSLTPGVGLQCGLTYRPTGVLLSDGFYSYSFGSPVFDDVRQEPGLVELRGKTETGLVILHRFSLDPRGSWIEEEIELTNSGPMPLDLHDARCGFTLPVPLHENKMSGSWVEHKFTAIPFRREPLGHREQYTDFSLDQVLTEQFSSELWTPETTVTPAFASEGWAWTNGTQGFLLSKYAPGGVEFAILDRVALPEGKLGLRWGGFGIYRGSPEHGAWLLPGSSHRFGASRLTAYKGGWQQGFSAFRREMEQRGHGCPAGFNPPVHWNELYDNKLWWLGGKQDDPEMRKKYYTLESMKEEAAKAKEIGCEALYMDPGWDTNFGSKIWDEPRLGAYKAFTSMLVEDYGLKSSLHTPLSGWCDPSSYPSEAYRVNRYGRRLTWSPSRGFMDSPICGASEQYLSETAKRLKTLARDGASFFMFDGTEYHTECWDLNHRHRVPARMEEHVQGMNRLARMVHADYPGVLIEMHDAALGGMPMRSVPIYYGHGRCSDADRDCQAAGFDTVWAFELMWMPMEDLLSGRAIALYYYNLAYSLPLYIHIDLRTDNANAIVFWWNASTCRHLGIGGTHPDPAVRQAQKQAMANYRRLKHYFASGTFHGIDESTHVHVAGDGMSAVVNCFNLDKDPVERKIVFDLAQLGLSSSKGYQFSLAGFRRSGDTYIGKVSIPGYGHMLIEAT